MLQSHSRLVRKLQDALGERLCVALEDRTVVEIMLNPDGKLFIERLGHGVASAGEMQPTAAETVMGSVAHALQSEADGEPANHLRLRTTDWRPSLRRSSASGRQLADVYCPKARVAAHSTRRLRDHQA